MVATFVLGPAFDQLVDDTEESILGTTIHQGTIVLLHEGFILCGPRRGLPWLVGNQLKLIVPRWSMQPAFEASPDLLIHASYGPGECSSLNVAVDGPPDLIIEVVSPSTARRDLNPDDPTCKPTAYAAIGVKEYLAFDPPGTYVPEQVRAWRLVDGQRADWLPEADGRWHSQLGISFAIEGIRLRVYDQQGRPMSGIVELADQVDWQEAQLQTQTEQLRAKDAELAQLRAVLQRTRDE